MDNGKSLLDVIDDTSEFFGSQNDSSGQMFNWADEFLGDNEMDISGGVSTESGNLVTDTPSNILLSSNYPSTSSIPAPTISIATTPFLQTSSLQAVENQPTVMPALLGQTIVNPLQSVPGQSGLSTQVLQQGNQHYILKTANGNQIQLTHSQLQQHILQQQQQQQQSNPQQSSSSASSSSVSMMNRSVTPNTGGIPTVSFGLGTSQYKSASPGPNVNIVHLPGNLQNQTQQSQPIAQQQSNQQTQQFQIAPGTFLQIPGGPQNLANTGIVQGQQTILTGQQGALMNSQNTVIQNPNVVNVNVATHQAVLCNSPAQQQLQQQQQQRMTGIQTTPQNPFNIQGTLIQTAEGKSILIPSQNLAQPINIQQLSMAQPVGQAQTQNQVGNMIQLAQSQTNMGSDSSQNQGLQQIVLNSQGQQILVQRAPTPGNQSQNIIVRTTLSQPGLVQIQQRAGQLQSSSQTIQTVPNTGTNPQLKIVQQTTQNPTGVPMINIGGQNITLQQISGQLGSIQGLQVVQQQQNQQQSTLNSQGQGQVLHQGQITLQQINSQGQVTLQPQAVLNSSSSHLTQQSRSSTQGQGSQGHLSFHRGQVAGQLDSFSGASLQSSANDSMHRQNQTIPQGQIASQSNHVQTMTNQTSQSSLENARNTQAQILLQQIQRSLKVTKMQDTVSSSSVSSSQNAPNYNVMLVKHDPGDKMKGGSGFSASPQSSTMTMQNYSTSNTILSSSQNVPNVNLIVKQENMSKMQLSSCSTSTSNQIQLPFQKNTVKKEPDLIESLVKQEVPSSIVTAADCSTTTSTVSQSTPVSLFLLNGSESVNSNMKAAMSSSTLGDNSNVISASSSGIQINAGNGGGGNVILGQHRTSATVQTIHLPPDLQQQFQRVQLEMKKVHAATNLTPEIKQTKLKQLQGFQKKILLKGRVLATTRAEPHHIKQGLAAFSQTGSNSSGMPLATSTVLSSLSMAQPSSSASSETPNQSITTVKDLLKSMSNPSQSMTSSSSNILQQLPSNTNNTGPGGLSFMNSSTTSSQALSALLASSSSTLTTPTVTATNQNSSTSMPSIVNQVEQAPPSSQTTMTVSQSALSSSVDNTVAPDVAVPTQIKIANKVLTLSLTKAQRDKVQSYLDRMTPEQQQQYLQTQQGVLQRIQKQQEMNAQIRAQMLAQKKQQALSASQNQIGGDSSISTSKQVQDAQIIKTEVKTIPVPNTSIQLNKQTPESVTRTLFRGQKRNYMDIPKGTLINQQIKQDQNHAMNPDTKRPFKSRGDACRRLLRYHVFQSYGPSEEEFAKFDGVMSEVATELLQKKEKMFDRFRVLLLHETMRSEPSSELVMLQRMQNQDLRKVIEDEKEQVKTDPDSFSPMPMKFLKKAETNDINEEKLKGEDKSSSDSEDMDATLVKSELNGSDTEEEKKVKKLVIKTDGENYHSSFKRQSLESSRSSIEGSEILNGSSEHVPADITSEPPNSVCNVEDEDTNDFDNDGFHSIHEEAEQAALLISSAEESQDSQTEEVENTFSDLQSRNSRHMSKNLNKASSVTGNSGNCELTSDVMYINESPSVTIDSRPSHGSYSRLSRVSSVDDTRKYLPNHSPVSNVSSDNDMIMEETQDQDKISNFDKYNMYQPITESLTDSEENSHYSADNCAEQNSIIIDDDDGHITKTSWKPEQQSKIVEQDVSDPESDQEVKAQMESAINSILSLGQSDSHSPYSYNQPSDIFSNTSQPHFEYSNSGNYQRSAVGRNSIPGLSEGSSYGMENEPNSDLDVAVNSILM